LAAVWLLSLFGCWLVGVSYVHSAEGADKLLA
jgi:hypothetical protein